MAHRASLIHHTKISISVWLRNAVGLAVSPPEAPQLWRPVEPRVPARQLTYSAQLAVAARSTSAAICTAACFSPAEEADDSGLAVTEYPGYPWTRTETGEAIRVPQALVFLHPAYPFGKEKTPKIEVGGGLRSRRSALAQAQSVTTSAHSRRRSPSGSAP
jgi:hypothetical protein